MPHAERNKSHELEVCGSNKELLLLYLMPKGGTTFAHEVVLVKFELQTHMENLSSCRSGFLVVFVFIINYRCILIFNRNV
jgi:hypothetical protein